MLQPKLYSLSYACHLFGIPRSVMLTGVTNGVIPTTLRYDTTRCRCRAKHYVTQADAEGFYRAYLDGTEDREEQNRVRDEIRRKFAKISDVFDNGLRSKIEDRLEQKRLAEYGVSAQDLA